MSVYSPISITGSFSVGRVAHDHNRRWTIKKNVETEYSKYNVMLVGKLGKKTTEEYVNDKMQPVINEYNKGKKPCRQIKTDYITYRNTNKNLCSSPIEYEAVIQIGEHSTLGALWHRALKEKNEKMIHIIHEQYVLAYSDILNELIKQYPHLDFVEAHIHFDETLHGTPHMHLDYIPFAKYTKKGLPVQVSIGGALGNDGIERIKERAEAVALGGYQITKFYKKAQNEIIKPRIDELVTNLGIDNYKIKLTEPGKKHMLKEEYEKKQSLENERQKIKENIDKLKEIHNRYQADIQKWLMSVLPNLRKKCWKNNEMQKYYQAKELVNNIGYDLYKNKIQEANTKKEDLESIIEKIENKVDDGLEL